MIDLTRLNGHRILVNCDLVKFVESTPDTTLTLVTGDRLIVRESSELLLELISAWRSAILRQAWPDAVHGFLSATTYPAPPAPRDQD